MEDLITTNDVKAFIKSLDCKFLLYLAFEKEGIKQDKARMIIYYVDNNERLRECNTKFVFNTFRAFNISRNAFRERINNDRIEFLNSYGYNIIEPIKGFNTTFAARVVRYRDYFENAVDAEVLANSFAHYMGINSKNSYDQYVNDLVCEWDIYCDFRNYTENARGFDTIQVDIPLISRGRTIEQQRNMIRILRPQLEKIAINSIKKYNTFHKSKLSTNSLYVYNLHHTRDNMLQFIFKVND